MLGFPESGCQNVLSLYAPLFLIFPLVFFVNQFPRESLFLSIAKVLFTTLLRDFVPFSLLSKGNGLGATPPPRWFFCDPTGSHKRWAFR